VPQLAAGSPAARPRRRRRRVALVAALAVPGLVLTGLSQAADAAPTPPETVAADAVVFYSVRAAGVEATDLAQQLLAAGLQADGRDHDGVTVMGNAATQAELEAIPGVEIVSTEVINPVVTVGPDGGDQDPILPKRLDGRTYETYYGGYRTVDGFADFLGDVEAAYPEMAQVVRYGTSFQGQPLRTICVTANAQDGCQLEPDVNKARFLLVTHIHARELTTSEVSWRFITHLLDGYDKDAQVTALLDSTEVWLIPHLNPDGLEVVQDGIEGEGLGEDSPAWQRKNLNPGDVACGGRGRSPTAGST
jgi:carboxypeptidase T